jgi:hypothetical protein
MLVHKTVTRHPTLRELAEIAAAAGAELDAMRLGRMCHTVNTTALVEKLSDFVDRDGNAHLLVTLAIHEALKTWQRRPFTRVVEVVGATRDVRDLLKRASEAGQADDITPEESAALRDFCTELCKAAQARA